MLNLFLPVFDFVGSVTVPVILFSVPVLDVCPAVTSIVVLLVVEAVKDVLFGAVDIVIVLMPEPSVVMPIVSVGRTKSRDVEVAVHMSTGSDVVSSAGDAVVNIRRILTSRNS